MFTQLSQTLRQFNVKGNVKWCDKSNTTGQHGGVDFESSRVYNVSRLDERYEIAYEPTWVEV